MIGYVFIRSGAIQTAQPELYPARQIQLDNLRYAFAAIGEDDARVRIEKAAVVTGIGSLPKLGSTLMYSVQSSDRVIIDDFRRVFLACPYECRVKLFRHLWVFRDVFWELEGGGRPLASISKDHFLELIRARSRVKLRLEPTSSKRGTAASRERQTSQARSMSARIRAGKADRSAGMLRTLRDEMVETRPSVTLEAIATEATKRGLKTSRGNPWSASSVHRALRRSANEPDSTVG